MRFLSVSAEEELKGKKKGLEKGLQTCAKQRRKKEAKQNRENANLFRRRTFEGY